MLLPPKVAHGVADGSVSLAFGRWRKQDVKPGATFRTPAGVIRVDEVTVVEAGAITDADAVLAGHPDAEAVRRRLAGDPTWPMATSLRSMPASSASTGRARTARGRCRPST